MSSVAVVTPSRVLAAPDKFRGTASAAEAAHAIAAGARTAGWECDLAPVSDGGEGLLECLGGANRRTRVLGPLGDSVLAPWRFDRGRAMIEMSTASGLALVGLENDVLAASSTGTGQLIAAAIDAGAREIIVGVGGSATTDGGLGAIGPLRRHAPLDGTRGPHVVVAADVEALFVDAAALFAPQKGADSAEVHQLTERLQELAERYRAEFGVDVRSITGSGAAGGLAGGLAALGAVIRPGFDIVTAELDLTRRVNAADLVVTGEGRFDATSLLGKAPASLLRMCRSAGVPGALVVGEFAVDLAHDDACCPAHVVDLSARFGRATAMHDTTRCIFEATAGLLAAINRLTDSVAHPDAGGGVRRCGDAAETC